MGRRQDQLGEALRAAGARWGVWLDLYKPLTLPSASTLGSSFSFGSWPSNPRFFSSQKHQTLA